MPLANRDRETQGLTDSSSATEAGEDGLNHGTDLNASHCSLERVVRPAPTERVLVAGRIDCHSGGGMTGAAAGKG